MHTGITTAHFFFVIVDTDVPELDSESESDNEYFNLPIFKRHRLASNLDSELEADSESDTQDLECGLSHTPPYMYLLY